MTKKQTTLKTPVVFKGVGIHTGDSVTMTLKPAKENYGIRFLRTDIKNSKAILATVENVVKTTLSVTIGKGLATISTIEHLLSAMQALELDNVLVEIDGPEVPILDGSAKYYIEKLTDKQINLNANKKYYKITKPVVVRNNDSFIYLLPADDFALSCKIDFEHPNVGEQVFHLSKLDLSNYASNIALAKTFGFLDQLDDLHKQGLAQGADLNNVIALNKKDIANPEKMTYENEFVRHKILDILGDVYLLGGKSLIAHVVAYKSGHSLHVEAIKEMIKTERYITTENPYKVKLKHRKIWTLKDVINKVF